MTSIAEALDSSIEQISRRREKSTTRQTSSGTLGGHDVCPACKGTGWMSIIDKDGCEIFKKCDCGLLKRVFVNPEENAPVSRRNTKTQDLADSVSTCMGRMVAGN